jgi:uncharacterized membrane protein (UPF0136 family)
MFAYAALVLAGGVFGYLKAGSAVSLAMSAAAAVLILIGVAIAKSRMSLGYGICAAVAAALAAFFGYRMIGGSLMPGLPAMLMSIIALGALTIGHFKKPA